MPKIPHTQYKNCYKDYKKIAESQKTNNMAGMFISTYPNFQMTPIMKKIIGIKILDNSTLFMDAEGNFFSSDHENPSEYISLSGATQFWPYYYEELEKYPKLLEKIYHVHIYYHRIDIYILPGILLKLNRSIKDANDFLEQNPKYAEKANYYIDLRNTKQVAYAEYNIDNEALTY